LGRDETGLTCFRPDPFLAGGSNLIFRYTSDEPWDWCSMRASVEQLREAFARGQGTILRRAVMAEGEICVRGATELAPIDMASRNRQYRCEL
jgi:hypothetical protein